MKLEDLSAIKDVLKQVVSVVGDEARVSIVLSGAQSNPQNEVHLSYERDPVKAKIAIDKITKGTGERCFVKAFEKINATVLRPDRTTEDVPKLIIAISGDDFPNTVERQHAERIKALNDILSRGTQLLYVGIGDGFNREDVNKVIGDDSYVIFLENGRKLPSIFDDFNEMITSTKSKCYD